MSRRKQSNPKSIKVPADPGGEGSSGQDPRLEDVKQEILSDQASQNGSESEMKPQGSSRKHGSLSSTPNSPDHIDVVNNTHTPPLSSPPQLSPQVPQPHRLESASPERVTVKVERDVGEDGSHDNDLVHTGSPQAQDGQSVTQGLVRHLQLPSDVLYLKKLEVSVHGNPTVSWVVCSAIPLPQGSSLGPFSGEIIASDSIKVGDLIVQFKCNRTGHMALVNVAGHTGAWLALLRPALDQSTRNTHVYLEGGRIWCEIVADIEQGTELRATFEFDLDELPASDRGMPLAPMSPTAAGSDPGLSAESSPGQQQAVAALQHASPPGHAALIYGCPFCGVRFSSPRTLQGHLSYYCSKKKSDLIVSPRPKPSASADSSKSSLAGQDMVRVKQEVDSADSSDGVMHSHSPLKARHTSGTKRPATTTDSSDISDHEQSSPPPAKTPHLDAAILRCPLCAYTADKPASLNRHMRMHNRPAETVTSDSSDRENGSAARSGPLPGNPTYCKECNIQFSSLSTFRCHKEFYCSQRRTAISAQRDDAKQENGQVMGGAIPASLAQELSAAQLQLASLGQRGFMFPSAQQAIAGNGNGVGSGGAIMSPGQATVIVMTPSGLANMAIPLPSVLVQSIQSAAAAAAAAAMGAPVSPAAHSAPQKPPQSPKPARSEASPCSVPDEAHQSRSPKKEYLEEDGQKDLPLDLSTKRSDSSGASDTGETPMDVSRSINPVSPIPSSNGGKYGASRVKVEVDEDGSPSGSSHSVSVRSPVASHASSYDAAARSTASPPSTAASTASLAGMPQLTSMPSLLPGFLPMHPLAAAAGVPTLPLPGGGLGATPSGISKCVDCNIIFYKHENYLVHKKVYCSGKKHRGDRPVSPENSPSLKNGDTGVVGASTSAAMATATATSGSRASQSPHRTPSPSRSSYLLGEEQRQQVFAVSGDRRGQITPGDLPPPVTATALPHTKTGLRSPLAPEEVYYKFYCIPCNIKFSSASNLKAHKEFYCPHGKNSEHTVIVQTPGGEIVGTGTTEQRSPTSNDSSPSPGQYVCNQCQTVFSSSRLLKLHLCTAEMAQTALLRCPHCDYVTQTDKRLSEHMKVHNPTSAYRCTLCGYRGNTVRGMRMHGKTHTDNGEEFTDSHMVEFQEPPLVPIQTNLDSKGVHGPLDLEAELIRLKNEPYKRRRSRKAFEKVDILALPEQAYECHMCGERFMDSRSFGMHLRIHEIASQYSQALVRCDQCDYVAKSLEDLRAHVDISHIVIPKEEKENHPRSVSPARTPSSEQDNTERCGTPHGKLTPIPISVKTEPIDTDYDHCGVTDTNSDPRDSKAKKRQSSPREGRESVKVNFLGVQVNGISDQSPERSEDQAHESDSAASPSPQTDKSGKNTASFALKPEPDAEDGDSVQQQHQPTRAPSLSETPPPPSRRDSVPHTVTSSEQRKSPEKSPAASRSPEQGASSRKRSFEQMESPLPSSDIPTSEKLAERASPSELRSSPRKSSPENCSSPKKSPALSLNATSSVTIKTEPDFAPHSLPVTGPSIFPYFFMPPPSSLPSPARDSTGGVRGRGVREEGGEGEVASGPSYCKNCDISFTYLSTFIAHKKYYCTGRSNVAPSATA